MQTKIKWSIIGKILFVIISGILIINFSYSFYNKIQNANCYEICADFHLSGDAEHWNFNDYVINIGDTIWIDEECYNEWCICIDECKVGLCCELLR